MPAPSPAPRRTHRLRAAIIFLVIVVALFLILPRLAGQKHALDLLRAASLPLLVVAVAAIAALAVRSRFWPYARCRACERCLRLRAHATPRRGVCAYT